MNRLAAFALLLMVVACTAGQRGWVAENLPWLAPALGGARDAANTTGQPLFAMLFGAVANWIVSSPEQSIPAGAAVAAAGVHVARGLPGTRRAKSCAAKKTATRDTKRTLDLLEASKRAP